MSTRFRRLLIVLVLGLPGFALAEPEARDLDAEDCGPIPEATPRIREALSTPAAEGASAVLVLPKAALAQIGSASELLGDGVEVLSSVWSPLLCSSISRIRGPANVAPEDWVPGLPDEGSLVTDDRYFTGAASASEAAPDDPATKTAADEAESATATPAGGPGLGSDPYRPLQYALDELELEASRIVTRGAGTRIAVLDSTPQVDHPDLGPIELRDRFVPPGASLHGTLITGLLAARPDNGFGIVGMVPDAEVIPIPVCRPTEPVTPLGDECALFDVLQGLDAAWNRRAHIVNLSLAGPSNPLLEGAMTRLAALGVSLVAAAGNDGSEEALYPAAYPTVIGVGATGRGGVPYASGNRGPGTEITAPGVDVVSTAPGGGFAFADGTSLATAYVSGALSLLASASGDLALAREALFRAARAPTRATRRIGVLPPICDALAEAGRPCASTP